MTRARKYIFPAILFAYLILATTLSVTIPLGEAADEVSHYAYISALITQHQLPAFDAGTGESHQPPLYYALVALVVGWIPAPPLHIQANPDFVLDNPNTPNVLLHPLSESFPYSPGAWIWHLMRLVSIALGALTLWATYRLVRETLPDEPFIAWGATAFIAFLPGFLFLSSVLNNDNLIVALATLTLWQLARIVKRAPRLRDGLLLGLVLGLAPLAKLTGFILWGLSGIVFLYLLQRRETRGAWLRVGIPAIVVALSVITPWLAYNQIIHADPFGWARFLAVTERPDFSTLAYWTTYATRMNWSFWGKYGGTSNLRLPDWTYFALNLFFVLALVGVGKYVWDKTQTRISTSARPLFALYLIFCVTLVAAQIRLETQVEGSDQARQIFSGLAPFALLLVWALAQLFKSRARLLAFIGGTMMVSSLVTVYWVTVTYAPNARTLAQLPPMAIQNAPADFENQIRIVNYQVASGPFAPGDQVSVLIYWQALSVPKQAYWGLLKLSKGTETIVSQDSLPALGRVTTDRWQTGQVFVSNNLLTLPTDIEKGIYDLQIGLRSPGTFDWLAVRGRDMLELGQVVVVTP